MAQLALRRERRETARHHALAHGEDGLLTRLLREALFDGDLPAAEELFLHWIRGAGPLLLAEGLEEAEKRRQFAAKSNCSMSCGPSMQFCWARWATRVWLQA